MKDLLNKIAEDELWDEVGITGINNLLELEYWLRVPENEIHGWQGRFKPQPLQNGQRRELFQNPLRLAPSLVCKSEVELFGRSMPRFAIRLSLEEGGGFVNLRRLGTFAGQLYRDELVPRQVINDVIHAPCIADAFLKPPKRLEHNWHVLTAPLGRACCEVEHNSIDQALTPFVRHMRPGGGMCAQAVCFMSSALHRELDAPVHGIPEITYIATEKNGIPPEQVTFDGLLTEEIATYFNSPRNGFLAARWEVSALPYKHVSPDILFDKTSSLVRNYENAVKAYVLSNIPVIVPVDVGRMEGIPGNGRIEYYQPTLEGPPYEKTTIEDPLAADLPSDSLFRRNGLNLLEHGLAPGNLAHVVLVVGCSNPVFADPFALQGTRPEETQILFVFNDPAHFPFMHGTAHELILASSYTDKESELDTMLIGWFLPVVPIDVKMPLLDEAAGAAAGIKSISAMLKDVTFRTESGVLVKKHVNLAGRMPEFRLIKANRNALKAALEQIYARDQKAIESIYSDLLHAFPETAGQWCWIEADGTDVLIWDAQKQIPARTVQELDQALTEARTEAEHSAVQAKASAVAESLLLAGAFQDLSGPMRIFTNLPSIPKPFPPMPVPKQFEGILKTALLSSFEAVAEWNDALVPEPKTSAIDFYMFMQRTAEKWLLQPPGGLQGYKQWFKERIAAFSNLITGSSSSTGNGANHDLPVAIDRASALTLMAAAADDQVVINRVADELLKSRFAIVSIATYLPGLCAGEFIEMRPEERPQTNPALLALRFILRVIERIKQKEPDKSPAVLELVGGSRLLSRIDLLPDTRNYDIRCIEESLAIKNIFVCISRLLPLIKSSGVRLALEFEPSCLMALGSVDTLEAICEELERRKLDDVGWELVGLNLDIAHFAFIAGLRPEQLPQGLIGRIFHSHISLHTRGHFADGIIEDNSAEKKERCFEWLHLIENTTLCRKFDGVVSLELECAKSSQQVQKSIETLNQWLT